MAQKDGCAASYGVLLARSVILTDFFFRKFMKNICDTFFKNTTVS
jgi:hypothetical protein